MFNLSLVERPLYIARGVDWFKHVNTTDYTVSPFDIIKEKW